MRYLFNPANLHQDYKKSFCYQKHKDHTLRAGLEPARGDPIGFQVQRLNHSAIAAVDSKTS